MKNKDTANNQMAHSHWLYIATLLAGVILLFAHTIFHDETSLLLKLAHELGIALIIAVVLIYTIDGISKKKHELVAQSFTEALNKDIFHAVYKRYIPSVVFEEVERCVLGSKVIREAYRVSYTIEPLNPAPMGMPCNKYVRCVAQSSYTIRNLTDLTIKQDVTVNLERPLDAQLESLVKIDSFSIDGISLTAAQIEAHTRKSDSQISFMQSIEIKPKGSVKISSRANIIKFSTDQEVWSSRIPSDGIELSVTVPMGGFLVSANANHSQPINLIMENTVTKRWDLKHGIFPFQSVVFWWHPSAGLSNCPASASS